MEYTRRRNLNVGYMKIEVWQPCYAEFEAFDVLHDEVDNKLLHLISSLKSKRNISDWQTSLPTETIHPTTHPLIQQSTHPFIR